MTYAEAKIGSAVPAECFTGTDIPKLSLEADDPWLTLLVPVAVELADEYIQRLNQNAAIAQGGAAARESEN